MIARDISFPDCIGPINARAILQIA